MPVDAVFGFDSVPFLATSFEASEKLWKAARPTVEKILAGQNLVLLYAVPWPPQGMYFKKELNGTEDEGHQVPGLQRGHGLDSRKALAYASAAETHGAIAQLGERYNGIVEVGGSIPPGSTITPAPAAPAPSRSVPIV